ncbi:TPA: hypothetical protein ACH9Q7_005957, partial [Escherichia coli]
MKPDISVKYFLKSLIPVFIILTVFYLGWKDNQENGSHNYVGDTMNLEGIISKESGTPLAKSTPSPQGVGILTWNSYVSTRLGIASFFYIS